MDAIAEQPIKFVRTDYNMFVLASAFQIILVSRLPLSVPTRYLIGNLRLCTQVPVQVPRSTSTLIATLIGISTSIFQCIFYNINQYIILAVPAPHFKLASCTQTFNIFQTNKQAVLGSTNAKIRTPNLSEKLIGTYAQVSVQLFQSLVLVQ